MSSRLQEPSGLGENSLRAALKVCAERVSLSALGASGDANEDAGLHSFVKQQTAGRRRRRREKAARLIGVQALEGHNQPGCDEPQNMKDGVRAARRSTLIS